MTSLSLELKSTLISTLFQLYPYYDVCNFIKVANCVVFAANIYVEVGLSDFLDYTMFKMESRVHCLFVFVVVYCYSLSFVVRLCFFRSCALSCCAVRCERWNPDTGQIDQPASKTFLSRLWRWWCWWASAWWCLLIQLKLGNYEELECNISENYLVIRFFSRLFFCQWALSLQVGFDLIGFKWI